MDLRACAKLVAHVLIKTINSCSTPLWSTYRAKHAQLLAHALIKPINVITLNFCVYGNTGTVTALTSLCSTICSSYAQSMDIGVSLSRI